MLKIFTILVLFNCAFTHAAIAPKRSYNEGIHYKGSVRYFHSLKKINFMGEATHATEVVNRTTKALTLGTRYRAFKNLKLGLFFSQRYGIWHDRDWIKKSKWIWRENDSRGEFNSILELSPRAMLDFIPGKNWIFEGRVRWEHNFHEQHDTIIVRPGLSYFWFLKGEPFMNFFAQYEIHHPLNYGNASIRENWAYFGILKHINPHFSVGLTYSLYKMLWEDFKSFRDAMGATYKSKEKGQQLGLFFVIKNLF